MKRFRGGLALKAHKLVLHSTPGWRESNNKERKGWGVESVPGGTTSSESPCRRPVVLGWGLRVWVLGFGV